MNLQSFFFSALILTVSVSKVAATTPFDGITYADCPDVGNSICATSAPAFVANLTSCEEFDDQHRAFLGCLIATCDAESLDGEGFISDIPTCTAVQTGFNSLNTLCSGNGCAGCEVVFGCGSSASMHGLSLVSVLFAACILSLLN
mmetsp:Transcript_5553/g.6355  ORF Transcript_5553/g.6355 Transcript_5553/m.6355 type:complete len:145 (+) Transcript_5553:166-600(+)